MLPESPMLARNELPVICCRNAMLWATLMGHGFHPAPAPLPRDIMPLGKPIKGLSGNELCTLAV